MHYKHQSGAALVIALILLVALSLMAISSMNTATLDLIMAGNEQYYTRAFTVSETGIQRAFSNGTFNSGSTFSQLATPSGLGNDTYAYDIAPADTVNVPATNSSAAFKAIYFRITSTGSSERGTTARHVQELYIPAPDSGDVKRDDDCGTANLESTISTC